MSYHRFDTAEKRWAGVGPYYAMFPTKFADEVIQQYTKKGDIVLDPFAGRATAIYSAAIHGRVGFGIEVNPVGWVYGKAKLHAARQQDVVKRVQEIAAQADVFEIQAKGLPIFFQYCFCEDVIKFLLSARASLDWRHQPTDWTIMAMLLIYLHGKRNESFSNQMRQTKSMAPEYSIRWWKSHGMKPPKLNPEEFILQRILWRYAKGIPINNGSQIYLGDCNKILPQLIKNIQKSNKSGARLLLTSPPYFGVTNYHYDQWIRLWLLGYSPYPDSSLGRYRDRFNQSQEYADLLFKAFTKASRLLDKNGVVYVRTDKRALRISVKSATCSV
jgi:hypothetical protein